jgi:hypothetical protein
MINTIATKVVVGALLFLQAHSLAAQNRESIQSQANEICSKTLAFAGSIAVLSEDNGKLKATLVIPSNWDEEQKHQFREAILQLSPECTIDKLLTLDCDALRLQLNRELSEENLDSGEFVRRIVLKADDGIVSVRPEGRLSSKIGHMPFSSQAETVERVISDFIEKQSSQSAVENFEFLVPDSDGMLTPVRVREQLSLDEKGGGSRLLKTIDKLRKRSPSDYTDDPCLKGSLIEIVPTLNHAGSPGEVQIYLWHSDRLQESCDWESKLKDSLGIENLRIVETNEIPLNTLKDKLNFVFQSAAGFDGCHLEYLSLSPVIEDDEILSINVLMNGFAAEQAQVGRINQAVEKLFLSAVENEALSDYLSFTDPACISNIELRRLNAVSALEWHTNAVSQFKSRQYDRALDSIQSACELDPSKISYRWWRCLLLLQLGRTKEAEQAMLEACLRFKKLDSSFGNSELFNSLQSVQGEMRKNLIDLEEKAKREMAKY